MLRITGSHFKGNKRTGCQIGEAAFFPPSGNPKKISQLIYPVYTYIDYSFDSRPPFFDFPQITHSIPFSHKTPKLSVTPGANETQTLSPLSSYNLLVSLDNSKIHDGENFEVLHSLGSLMGQGWPSEHRGWDGSAVGLNSALLRLRISCAGPV